MLWNFYSCEGEVLELPGYSPSYQKNHMSNGSSANKVSNNYYHSHFANSKVQFTISQYQYLLSLLSSQISQATEPNQQYSNPSTLYPIGIVLSTLSNVNSSMFGS